jgi:hypothetical protein
MIKKNAGLIAAIALAVTLVAAPASQAHDSNTLHKIGKAVQYPVRKDTENLSVDAHRGEGRKSVESMRPQRATAVVTSNGDKYVVAHRGNASSIYAHRRHRHHRHHHTH